MSSPTPSQSRVHHKWQPDSSARRCTICDSSFNILRRRHHCRRCGCVICNDCSMHRLRIPVARIAVDLKHVAVSDSDEMDVVRVCDTCYSKHQTLKSKRTARAASIESNNTLHQHSHQRSRPSSRHSSPSSSTSAMNNNHEHITHQLLRPSSSGQLTSHMSLHPSHNQHIHSHSRSPHSPAQESVLPSVPSLPRTPRQLDDTNSLSKLHDQRARSHSSSDTLSVAIASSNMKRSMSSASQSDERHAPVAASRHLDIVTSNNVQQQPTSSSSSLSSSPSRRSPQLRDVQHAAATASDFMSPKNVQHRSEFISPAWCDNVLAATGITLPVNSQTTNEQSINQSLQTETFMDSLDFLSWFTPIMKLFTSFTSAFSDRPVACLIVVPLITIIIHRLRPLYQAIIVIMQLITLHNAIWRMLNMNDDVEQRSIKRTITTLVHAFLHNNTTSFQSTQSEQKSVELVRHRAAEIAWLSFGLFACYISYFVRWPVFWSACIIKDLTRVVVKKQKTN